MRLLRRLLPRPVTIEDPLFGTLLFQRMPDPARSYWEGGGPFAPAGRAIEYFVHAGPEGPGEGQRRLYRRIEARFPELRDAVAPHLGRSYREWFRREPPADVWRAFVLSSLSVPRAESDDMEWELTFDCAEDENHIWTVALCGWRPTGGVSVDG